jgi:N-dimethylarginine dimethylaminohydrolase
MHDRLIESGATLKYIEPHPDFPDMVFTANAGLVKDKTVILSNNKHPQRQGESPLFKKWFLDHGYKVIELPKDIYFEGAGDAIFIGDLLFMGYGFRTSKEAHSIIANVLGVDYVSCELVNPKFYHLDTCFFSHKQGILYYLDAFSEETQRKILMNIIGVSMLGGGMTIAPARKKQAEEFICNSVLNEDSIITPSHNLGSCFLGYNIYSCNMSEFMKSGGAVKCLTLQL